ncbi:MAG: hypothetical protein ACREMA_09215 [Longimicrobiales bacterium]
MITRFSSCTRWLAGLATALLFAACTEEDPTDIGGPLLPSEDVETFEVILEAAQYMRFDTAFSGYADAFDTNVLQVMRNFEGVTNGNALFKYGTLPTTLTVRDSTGASRTDTLARFPDGYILITLDSAASRGAATIGAYHTGQEWQPQNATWTVRMDTGNVKVLWSQPGGTRAARIGGANWPAAPGSDSVTIPLDSVAIKTLTDTANHARGLLLALDQATGANGASLRINSAILRVNGRSRIRPDTTIVITLDETSTFVFDPTSVAPSGAITVSGVPAWRGMLGLVDGFRNLEVPCPGAGCTVRIRDAFVNLAEVLLQPAGSPAGFAPEDSIVVVGNVLLQSPGVPLQRSPIAPIPGQIVISTPPISAARFTNADTGPAVGLPVTGFITAVLNDTATVVTNQFPRQLAFLSGPEAATFGLARFRTSPRLRLVLTISTEQRQ